MRWRLAYLGKRDAYDCSSYPEAFKTAMERGLIPNTFYIYRYAEPTARCSKISDFRMVKHQYCQEHGVKVVRNFRTSGPPVYLDSSVLVISIFYRTPKVTDEYVFPLIKKGIADALAALGLKVIPDEGLGNDIIVDGKKVASLGNSYFYEGFQAIGFDVLLDFEFDIAEKAIVPKHNMRETMTTLKAELGRKVSPEKLINVLKTAFEPLFSAEFQVEYKLTEEEENIVASLRDKYTSDSWIRLGKWSPVKEYWRPK